MLSTLRMLLYPFFGAVVLFGYLYVVRLGIEPFEVSSEKRELPAASRGPGGSGYRRSQSAVFWYGGFGGK